jgi:CheY-like chemotaxis protein
MMARILVIDDEALVRDAVAAMLRGAGHEVRLAGDGEAGLRAYRRERFDLVVTDIVMPRMEGIETVRAIRRTRRPVKILAISGAGRSGAAFYLTAATVLGADASLVKPFTAAELRRAVEHVLAGAAPPCRSSRPAG